VVLVALRWTVKKAQDELKAATSVETGGAGQAA